MTKFSSILALPVFGLILIIYTLIKNNDGENKWKVRLKNLGEYLSKGILAFLVAMIVIWIVYEVNIFNMPKETFAKTVDFFFSADDSNLKSLYTNKALHALNQSDITRPLGAYLFGPAWTFKRVSGGNGAYFLQQVGNGFTWYFPVVFVIKETLPFLFLAILSLAFTAKQVFSRLNFSEIRARVSNFLKKSVVEYTLFIFIILYVYVSISGGLNIGFRHLFPILPFAYLLISKKISDFTREIHLMSQRTFRLIVLIFMIWVFLIPVINYPSYTSYFNESIGGSKNGYAYVTDSNTDWGQDLKRLKTYVEQNPEINKIRVDYFGGGDIKHYIGDKYIMWWDSKRPVETGWYAISTNFLQGSIYDSKKTTEDSYKWTKEFTPVTMIGKSIFVYYVDRSPRLQ